MAAVYWPVESGAAAPPVAFATYPVSVSVTVPPGAGAGSRLQVIVQGQTFQVVVPLGAQPGRTMQVTVPLRYESAPAAWQSVGGRGADDDARLAAAMAASVVADGEDGVAQRAEEEERQLLAALAASTSAAPLQPRAIDLAEDEWQLPAPQRRQRFRAELAVLAPIALDAKVIK